MKLILKAFGCGVIALASGGLAHAKEWRGIVPLRSTAEDVERLLGPQPGPEGPRTWYSLKNESVELSFSDLTKLDCATRLPKGTVMRISVRPKAGMLLSDLTIDEKRFRRFDPSSPAGAGYEAYIDEQEGLIIRAFEGKVEELVYIASAEDRQLCPAYYERPESFVQLFLCGGVLTARMVDEYGSLPPGDENARLDNFALALQDEPGAQGYIIAYAGREALMGEAQALADRAKKYLDSERGMPPGRIVAVSGGRRSEPAGELFIVPIGAPPPSPSQTTAPNDAQGVGDAPKRSKPRGSKLSGGAI